MFRFFRQFRQRFLTENRFRHYLLYATGEILLVVIGILLALQIDAWNEDRIAQNLSDQIVRNLESELTEFREKIERTYIGNSKYYENYRNYLESERNLTSQKDSALMVIDLVSYNPVGFDLLPILYQETGPNPRIRNNPEVLTSLRLLRSWILRVEGELGYLDSLWNSQIIIFLSESGYMSSFTSIAKGFASPDYRLAQLYDNTEFRELVASEFLLFDDYLSSLEALIDQLDNTLEILRAEG